MNTSSPISPERQALQIAKANYDRAHQVWFNTSVFATNADLVKAAKEVAKEEYIAAYKAAYPGTIIL